MNKYRPVQTKLCKLHATLPWSHMAEEAGISASTIKKFAHDETRRPQFRTVDLLADYVGFRLQIQDLHLNTVLKLRRVK